MAKRKKIGKKHLIISLVVFSGLTLSLLFLVSFKQRYIKKQLTAINSRAGRSNLVNSNKNELPLIALAIKGKIQNENGLFDRDLYLFDPNSKELRQITQNQPVKIFSWTKDGQWLYWYTSEKLAYQNYRKTFYRAKAPDFIPKAFWQTNQEYDASITFFPLKNGSLLVTIEGALKYMDDFENLKPKTAATLIEKEGFGYSVSDINPAQNQAIVREIGWEHGNLISTGILDLKTKQYQPVADCNQTPLHSFSPDGRFILASVPQSPMIKTDYHAMVYRFPELEIYRDISNLTGKPLGKGKFLNNNLIVIPADYNTPEKTNPKPGLMVIDFQNGRIENFFSQFEDLNDIRDSYCNLNASQNLIVYRNHAVVGEKASGGYGDEIGYLVYIPETKEFADKHLWGAGRSAYDFAEFSNDSYLPAPQPTIN